MQEEEWRDKEAENLDLRLENRNLETEINLRGGETFKCADIDPGIENEFLKNVLAFEEAEKEPGRPMRSVFPADYEFPPASSLTKEELSRKLDEIEEILGRHNVGFGFANDLPDEVLYTHLVEECIPNETVMSATGSGFTWFLDGCTGNCEDCFQAQYCKIANERDEGKI